jgi:hypothetical protein
MSQPRSTRGAYPLPDCAVYEGGGFRLSRAVDEQPGVGCGRVIQSPASCGVYRASRSNRSCSVAVGACEGQRLKGILLIHLVLGCISSLLICLVFGFICMRDAIQGNPYQSITC